jgi:hypothetical protein
MTGVTQAVRTAALAAPWIILRTIGYVIMSFATVAVVCCVIEIAARLYLAFTGAAHAEITPRLDPTGKMTLYRAIFPDLSEDQISAIFSVTYREVYAPWVGFRTDDISSPLVNVRGFVRATVPDRSIPEGDPIEIAFFGGSTMEGVRTGRPYNSRIIH